MVMHAQAASRDALVKNRCGCARDSRLRERAAYDWAAELSVYLARGMQGKGLGTMLYRCLIELLGLQHLRGLYGCVTLPNEKSERLH